DRALAEKGIETMIEASLCRRTARRSQALELVRQVLFERRVIRPHGGQGPLQGLLQQRRHRSTRRDALQCGSVDLGRRARTLEQLEQGGLLQQRQQVSRLERERALERLHLGLGRREGALDRREIDPERGVGRIARYGSFRALLRRLQLTLVQLLHAASVQDQRVLG